MAEAKLTEEEVIVLKRIANSAKAAKPTPQLRSSELNAVRELLAKQGQSPELKLTHEFIQELSDLVDMSPLTQEALYSWSLTMMAWENILLAKGLVTKEEIEKEALKIKQEMPQQNTKEILKAQLEEAAKAYR